jgi:uncharacterized OB-fold protein
MSIYDPVPSKRSTPYWDAIENGELRFQQCEPCRHRWMSARDACPRCGGAPTWQLASGRASVYSFSVVRRAPTADLRDRVPYVIALVDVAEGPRTMTWIIDCEPEGVTIGMDVVLHFATGPGTVTLPLFRPASD